MGCTDSKDSASDPQHEEGATNPLTCAGQRNGAADPPITTADFSPISSNRSSNSVGPCPEERCAEQHNESLMIEKRIKQEQAARELEVVNSEERKRMEAEAQCKRNMQFRQKRDLVEKDHQPGYRSGIEKQEADDFASIREQARKCKSEVQLQELMKLGVSKEIAEIVRERSFLVNNDLDRLVSLLVSNGLVSGSE